MENKSHALAAGAFVLLMLALLVTLALWLARDAQSQRIYELSSAQAISGLQPQATVRFKGVNVGKVTAIGFDSVTPGHVLIRIAVDEQAPITESTFATLGFQGVTGLAFIALDDPGTSKVALRSDVEPPARIPMRPGLLAELSERGLRILGQLEDTTQRVNQLLSADNQKAVIGAIDNIGQAARGLQQFSDQTGKLLGPLATEATGTLKTLQATSDRVGDSADEARVSARAFRTVTERMNEPGGTLDQLSQGVSTLGASAQTLNTVTLPHLNRALGDTASMARQVGRAAANVSDNPQALFLGNSPVAPGPGEAGFSATPGQP
ncbi:MAG: MCE family protein [Gammaproteobacteria bacterium]|uniref:MlaD family protein n=1 Tax=Rhodoferax sp. TaxID=50421 RepID=UPI001814AE0E|nr:MlaD family protein [Rhodoferax sp.]MBU3900794.1 MCE family protein [Gammaproteobacteria bacterium]MBA3056661.1 MCE family protein [Rhodoferax sp.]MBU3997175.1 MCE family protein [Gammaproteobacteria bacterium]MBU4079545.1 MCE family protein [Gammaproteobacteria bacterium]MBU4114747.1 MCE family protein [Gammaproteobacteria bacterium]